MNESTTDPEARLARKSSGHESKLAYCGNVLIENRIGLVVDTELVLCSGTLSATRLCKWRSEFYGDQHEVVSTLVMQSADKRASPRLAPTKALRGNKYRTEY